MWPKYVVIFFTLEFPTTRLEMEAVADIFDGDHDGYIDYKEFVTALRPDRQDVSVPTEIFAICVNQKIFKFLEI